MELLLGAVILLRMDALWYDIVLLPESSKVAAN